MKSENFLNYKNWFFAKLVTVFSLLSFVVYLLDDPIGGPRGNTLIGYFFGAVALILILYLTYFGIRKRSYYSGKGLLVAYLSAHVWLGVFLLILVPLHSGFNFGLNIHTLSYVFMVIVVLSGICGALFYRYLPMHLRSQRGGTPTQKALGVVRELDADILCIADTSKELSSFAKQFDFRTSVFLRGIVIAKRPPEVNQSEVTSKLASLQGALREDASKILSLIAKKREILNSIVDEIRAAALLRVWLFIHVPCTFLLLIALAIHLYFAFAYWA